MSIYLAQQKEGEMKSLIRGQITSISLCSQLCKQETQLFMKRSSVLADGRERQGRARKTRKLLSWYLKNEINLHARQGHGKGSQPRGRLVLSPLGLPSLRRHGSHTSAPEAITQSQGCLSPPAGQGRDTGPESKCCPTECWVFLIILIVTNN